MSDIELITYEDRSNPTQHSEYEEIQLHTSSSNLKSSDIDENMSNRTIRKKSHHHIVNHNSDNSHHKIHNATSRETMNTRLIKQSDGHTENTEGFSHSEIDMSPCCQSRCMVWFKSCCTLKHAILFLIALALFLFFVIWIAYVQSRVNVLEHKMKASEKVTCNIHMFSDYVRPEPDEENLAAMGHGYIALEPESCRLCYNFITTNVTSEIKSIGIYGPLDSIDLETGELFLDFQLPASLPEPNQYIYCMTNVSSYIFDEFTSKTGLFHVSAFSDCDPPNEIMRSYIEQCV